MNQLLVILKSLLLHQTEWNIFGSSHFPITDPLLETLISFLKTPLGPTTKHKQSTLNKAMHTMSHLHYSLSFLYVELTAMDLLLRKAESAVWDHSVEEK